MRKKIKALFFLSLFSIGALAGPLGGDNTIVLEEDTFELSSFDTTQSYVAKNSALGAYSEVRIDSPEMYLMSPHIEGICTSQGAEGTATTVGFSFQDGLCRSLRFPSVSGDSTTPGTVTSNIANYMMFLGSVDPYNKSALTLFESLSPDEEASIDCSVIKNATGEIETLAISDGISGIGADHPFVHTGDVGVTYTTVEQGFDCRIAKDASGDMKIRMRGITLVRFLSRNLPPVDVNLKNGDLVYQNGVVAEGVHHVNDIRLVDTSYDSSVDGDGVGSGKFLSSVTIGQQSTVNQIEDAFVLIDYEFDVESLKNSANTQLSTATGIPELSSDYALGEVELEYTFQTI